MNGEEFQGRLQTLFIRDGRPYGTVAVIHEAEAVYGQQATDMFRGHFALSDAFKCVFMDAVELMNTHCRPQIKTPLSEFFPQFLPRLVNSFHTICGAECAAIRGYPRPAFTTLRNAFDDSVLTSAALQKITTFYALEGIEPNSAFDPAAVKVARKKEEFRVNKTMLWNDSGLEPGTQDSLRRLNDLYDMEVHGSRLSLTDAMDFMKMQGPLHVVPNFVPKTFALFMNRFTEVAWLIHRLLPGVQPPSVPMPDEWMRKWKVVDDSFDIAVKSLFTDTGLKIGQEYPKFVEAKFPFNSGSFFPL